MRKYTKAVSATLAGALAAGMVPAMALADDDVVELQSEKADDVKAGSIATFDEAAMADYAAGYVFTAGSNALAEVTALVPETVEGLSGKDYEVVSVAYYKLPAAGAVAANTSVDFALGGKMLGYDEFLGSAAPTTAGSYAVVAQVKTSPADTEWCRTAVAFSIIPAELSGAAAYEVEETGLVLSDTEFVWKDAAYTFGTANDQLNIKIGNKALTDAQYNVKAIYDANGSEVEIIENAGYYEVLIEGEGIYAGAKDVKVPVTIEKLNLGEALLEINGINDGVAADLTDLYFVSASGIKLQGQVQTTYSPDESGTLGQHTATVVMLENAADAKNVEGTGIVNYIVVDKLAAVAAVYDDNADGPGEAFGVVGTANDPVKVGAVNGKAFKGQYIVDVTADGVAQTKDQYDVVVERFVGPEATDWVASSVTELEAGSIQGTYRVKVVIDAADATINYAYAGSAELYVEVDNGVVYDATAAYTHEGILVPNNSLVVEFDGADVMDDIKVSLAANIKDDVYVRLVEGTDFNVAVQKAVYDAAGALVKWADVDAVVDAGDYRVVPVCAKYSVDASAFLGITVEPADATAAIVDTVDCKDCAGANVSTILWNGKEVNPIAGFVTGPKGKAIDVPASAYSWKIVDYKTEGRNGIAWSEEKPNGPELPTVVKDAGIYTIEVADIAADNYAVQPGTYILHVTADSVFKDVPSDAWFADEVWLADQLGYMNGYKVGDLFGPYDSIIRGDAALVLFRMAGADQDDTLKVKFDKGTYTPFEDVYQGAYYAKAIAWADDAEIMTGYGDGANFGPNDKITREQVATALYRYDQKLGKEDNLDVLASALDAYVDGDEVSAWAVEAMEWAVAEGVMGVNTDALNPQDEITRAEFAAMMVRYQPQGKLPVEDEEQGA